MDGTTRTGDVGLCEDYCTSIGYTHFDVFGAGRASYHYHVGWVIVHCMDDFIHVS